MRVVALLILLICLAGCASAKEDSASPDIRVSGTWQGGVSWEKGFSR